MGVHKAKPIVAAVMALELLSGCSRVSYMGETSIETPTTCSSFPIDSCWTQATTPWWSLFDDSALQLMICRAIKENRSLQIATLDALTAGSQVPIKLEALKQQRLTIIEDVIKSYLEWRTGIEIQSLSLQLIAKDEEMLALKQELIARGVIGDNIHSQIQSQLAALQAELYALDQSIALARHHLLTLQGAFSNQELQAISCQPLPTPPAEIAIPTPAELLKLKPSLRQAERLWALSQQGIFPPPSPSSQAKCLVGAVNLNQTLPEIDINGVHAALMCQSSAALRAQYSYEQALLEANEQLVSAKERYQWQFAAYIQRENVLKQQKLLEVNAKELYRRGIGDQLAVAETSKAVIEAQKSLIQVTKELLLTYVIIHSSYEPADGCSSTF